MELRNSPNTTVSHSAIRSLSVSGGGYDSHATAIAGADTSPAQMKTDNRRGRDHWAPLTTLAMAGGGLKMGQVVGKSDAKGTRPATKTITPQDLMATVFHTLGIDQKTQFINQGGRPVYMLEDGKPISELV